MNVLITFTSIGSDAGPFNLFSDASVPPFCCAFETGVTATQLTTGFPSDNAPNGTTIVRVKSAAPCSNSVDLPITEPTTTTTTTLVSVYPVIGTCCGLVETEYILATLPAAPGQVIASVSEGAFIGYVVQGPAILGIPTIVAFDSTVYGSCFEWETIWAGFTCI